MTKHHLTPARLAMLALATAAFAAPAPAHAYIGPGAGMGAIVVAIALLLGVILLVVGLVWYPLKRMLKGRAKPVTDGSTAPVDAAE